MAPSSPNHNRAAALRYHTTSAATAAPLPQGLPSKEEMIRQFQEMFGPKVVPVNNRQQQQQLKRGCAFTDGSDSQTKKQPPSFRKLSSSSSAAVDSNNSTETDDNADAHETEQKEE